MEAELRDPSVAEIIRESRVDYKEGRYTEGLEKGLARMKEIWANRD